jgi:hypothetical protein
MWLGRKVRRAQGRVRGITRHACTFIRGLCGRACGITRGVLTKIVLVFLVCILFLMWIRPRFMEHTRPSSPDRCQNLSSIVRRTPGARLILENCGQGPPWSAEAGYSFHDAIVSPTTEVAVGNSTCFVTTNLDCFSEAHGVVFQGAWDGWGLFDATPFIDGLVARYRPVGQVWFVRSEETPESRGTLCSLLSARPSSPLSPLLSVSLLYRFLLFC